jgi:hypothetical protein
MSNVVWNSKHVASNDLVEISNVKWKDVTWFKALACYLADGSEDKHEKQWWQSVSSLRFKLGTSLVHDSRVTTVELVYDVKWTRSTAAVHYHCFFTNAAYRKWGRVLIINGKLVRNSSKVSVVKRYCCSWRWQLVAMLEVLAVGSPAVTHTCISVY